MAYLRRPPREDLRNRALGRVSFLAAFWRRGSEGKTRAACGRQFGPRLALAAWVVWTFLAAPAPEIMAQPNLAQPAALTIAPATNAAVLISWPATNGAFSLQTSTNLWGNPEWEILPVVPFTSQGFLNTLVPRDAARRFFQLAYSTGTNTPPPLFALPQLAISQPVTSFTTRLRTNATAVTLAGTVNDPDAVVMVQTHLAGGKGTNWVAAGVSLPQEGDNLIVITATSPSGAQTVEHLVIDRDTTVLQPLGLQVLPLSPSTNQLTWLPSGESDLAFTSIYWFTNGASVRTGALIGTAPAPSTLFYDTKVVPGVSFCYMTAHK